MRTEELLSGTRALQRPSVRFSSSDDSSCRHFCSFFLLVALDAHLADVVSLQWLQEYRILITGGRDGDIKVSFFV